MKLVTSALFDQLSGKMRQFVVRNNLTRPNASAYTKTPNHKSITALTHKQLFNELCAMWSGYAEAFRLQYSALSNSYPQVDKFGRTYYLSGFQLYILLSFSTHRYVGGDIQIPVIPYNLTAPNVIDDGLKYASNTWLITQNDNLNNGEYYDFFCGQPCYSPLTLIKKRFTYLTSYAGNINTQIDLMPFFLVHFPLPGQYYSHLPFAVQKRSTITGLSSVWSSTETQISNS